MSQNRVSRTNCCVYGCHNTYGNTNDASTKVRFFSIPKKPQDEKRREAWIQFASRKNKDGSTWTPGPNARICSVHFVNNESVNHPLSPSYAPTLYPKGNVPHARAPLTQSQLSRHSRFVKRRTNAVQVDEAPKTNNLILAFAEREDTDSENVPVPLPGCENALQIAPDCPKLSDQDVSMIDYDAAGCDKSHMKNYDENLPDCDKLSEQDVNMIDHQVPDYVLKENHYANLPRNGLQNNQSPSPVENAHCPSCSCGKPKVSTRDIGVGIGLGMGIGKAVPTFYGFQSPQMNQENLRRCTSLDPNTFNLLHQYLVHSSFNPLVNSIEDWLLLSLIRLKHDTPLSMLSVFFNVPESTVRHNFIEVLRHLAIATKRHIYWPTRKQVEGTMPESFRRTMPDTFVRSIVDCTEIKCEKIASIREQNLQYSHYKGCHTIKILVSITPNGFLSFLSKAYGGRASDGFITLNSGYLLKLESGDNVLADKGFPVITAGGAKSMIPARRPKDGGQFTLEQLATNVRISSLRIHVERWIQRLKNWSILKNTVPVTLLPYIDDVLQVCGALVNLGPPIIKEKVKLTTTIEMSAEEDYEMDFASDEEDLPKLPKEFVLFKVL